jgi:hypothetical protein
MFSDKEKVESFSGRGKPRRSAWGGSRNEFFGADFLAAIKQ